MAQTALITGAAKRIGRALSLHLAAQGWNIAIHYNSSQQEALTLQKELKSLYANQQFEIFKADLYLADQVEKLIPQVLQLMPGIDLLINNASVFNKCTLAQTDTELFNQNMNINFRAPFILTREFINRCGKGLIINFVDTKITNNKSNYAAYTLSKKALWEMTKMTALEVGPNIRINAIAPGLTLAPEEKPEEYLWKMAENIALKRPGGLQPVLKSLDYILENDYLTGQLLFCDGGENLGLTN
ncbi:MAG TPA: SDR family NAD(P)-dependent oxidoreductase [Prolixibacteraceae bacterium]|nr:SDR family NAD(P)-dependent oxidoreductase [Prolixibacteraceae bacterium]